MSDRDHTLQSAPADASISIANGQRPDREGRPTGAIPGTERRAKVESTIAPGVVRGFLRVSEGVFLSLIGLAIALVYVGEDVSHGPLLYSLLLAALPTFYVIAADFSRIYRIVSLQSEWGTIPKAFLVWTGSFLFFLVCLFLLKESETLSRVWLTGWYCSGLVLIAFIRTIAHKLVSVWAGQGRLQQNIVLVGGGQAAERLIDAIRASGITYINICGVFDDRTDDRGTVRTDGISRLGSFGELVRFARSNRVDMLLVAMPMTAEKRVLELMSKLWVLPVDIRLSALNSKLRFESSTYSYLGNVPFLDIYKKPLTDWDFVLKAVSDRVIAAVMLIMALPLFAVIAIAIKLDSKGPVFFKQRRFGFNNELVEVYKFRSLRHESSDANASKLVTADDDRVTKVGRFIRRTSIDELPQLISVLKGDMSMVGPRPHAVLAKAGDQLYGDVVDGYFARHRVKPGITGWAQINGWRGETDTDEKIVRRTEYDLYYIDNWSLLLDLYIILRTPWALLRGENAY